MAVNTLNTCARALHTCLHFPYRLSQLNYVCTVHLNEVYALVFLFCSRLFQAHIFIRKKMPSLLLALLVGTAMAQQSTRRRPRRIGGKLRQTEGSQGRPSIVNCTWGTFQQTVDHFGDSNATFPQRYCLYDKWWKTAADGGFKAKAGAPGPILFYTGNESPVEEYINNTGLMWELGESLSAVLIFAEHRYEPLSHPAICGAGTQQCFAYCTTAQANADWATLIKWLRTKHQIRAPAVAFGGSYGGDIRTHSLTRTLSLPLILTLTLSLAATFITATYACHPYPPPGMLAGWFRMKYPDVIDGAIAASAPIWQLADTVRTDTLDMQAVAITRGVSASGGATDQCRDNLIAAWPLLREVAKSKAGLKMLGKSVKLVKMHSCMSRLQLLCILNVTLNHMLSACFSYKPFSCPNLMQKSKTKLFASHCPPIKIK